ncbi:hypothetical protein PK35_13790 [Tamlana nanhaiensis]|uniref:histidine kinase n=1 Tax=Neotamlana nanhaiensis TaxID=1382798 RepID=A0A0D7VYG1_9FLAO|nr:tetratricopeptide repeat protein [Tamlana nanhaiensis]KJD31814.1 hypothetical protein PK35_13790 [Tamlana nanhaiensis]
MAIFLRLCLLFLFSTCVFAQDAKPDAYQDSLQTIINGNSIKSEKEEALFLLGEYVVQRDPELAERTANTLKQDYIDKDDADKHQRNNYILAASHRWQGDYKTALDYYQKIHDVALKTKDSLNIARSAHFIGSLNSFLGNNVISQNHLLEAASIYEKIGSPTQKASINNVLAGFYWNIDQLEKGKDKYLLALEQFETLNDSAGMASTHANLGMLFTELNDFEKAETHLMQQKALNKVFPTLREMGFHHDFLGVLRQKQGRLQEAYQEHLKALQIRENLSSTYNLCESKLNMGEVLIKLGRYPEAISHLKTVFEFDEHQSLYQQQAAYELLSQAYEKSGRFKEALQSFKDYTTLSDSIYSKESIEIIAEKDAKYEKQKTDAEIALLSKEKEVSEAMLSRSRIIITASLIGVLVLLIAAIAFYKMYAKNKQKNKIITKALSDRELLLHETHHRVKNNLQMISSLLNLQSKYVTDAKALEVLQNGRNRVQSMAILHKSLYSGEDLNMVNIQEYFSGLVKSIFNSYNKSEHDIKTTVKAKNLVLDLEEVIPLGLIVNELVTNSLKHAFPETIIPQPEINVEMIETDTLYKLLVSDNGIGGKKSKGEKEQEASFGQRLLKSLTQKLKAKITTTNKNGTEVSIEIPKKA